ncbi:unnamed protein product [Adineta ricciae]|uniref:TRPM SLOG domain-containing protein n=1 Tax=Adineta ricciae TaxID=249248 RepID=A0A815UJ43_ADIRI|nr:unnamed protein product [Adineta ricciae]
MEQTLADKITEATNEWIKELYDERKRYDSKCGTETRKYITDDFGQIHFSTNDRESWYIRMPFVFVEQRTENVDASNFSTSYQDQHVADQAQQKHMSARNQREHTPEEQHHEHTTDQAQRKPTSRRNQREHTPEEQHHEHTTDQAQRKPTSRRNQREYTPEEQHHEHTTDQAQQKPTSRRNQREHTPEEQHHEHTTDQAQRKPTSRRNQHEFTMVSSTQYNNNKKAKLPDRHDDLATNQVPHENLSNIESVASGQRRESTDSYENFTEDKDCEVIPAAQTLDKSPAAEIVRFMRTAWKLPEPELIISVTGGAKFYNIPSPRMRNALQQGLISAVTATNAWVFTGGTHFGIMKEIGDAFDKCRYKNTKTALKTPCIGICSWYATTDYKQLLQNKAKNFDSSQLSNDEVLTHLSEEVEQIATADEKRTYDTFSHRLKKTNEQRVRLYRMRHPPEKGEAETYPLDHNHTHFLLLADQFGPGEMKWRNATKAAFRADLILPIRAQIEQASRVVTQQGHEFKIPIVQILIEGGTSSILTVCESINAQTPVILVTGTGRAADFIAHQYKCLYGQKDPRSMELYDEIANDGITFEKFKENINFESRLRKSLIPPEKKDKFINMMQSKKGYFLLNSLHLSAKNQQLKLDDAILQAQFNAALLTENKEEQKSKRLKLAMAWNKYDTVATTILENQTLVDWPDLQLDDCLREAVRLNSVYFVELLVEGGASFERLRRLIRITDMYKDISDDVFQNRLPVDKQIDKITFSKSKGQSSKLDDDLERRYWKAYLNRDKANDTNTEQSEDHDISGKNA